MSLFGTLASLSSPAGGAGGVGLAKGGASGRAGAQLYSDENGGGSGSDTNYMFYDPGAPTSGGYAYTDPANIDPNLTINWGRTCATWVG